MIPESERPAIQKPEKGLTGIASSYKKETTPKQEVEL